MREVLRSVLLLSVCLFPAIALAEQDVNEYEYVILASKAVREDAGWNRVIDMLKTRHDAFVIPFGKWPEEALPVLKKVDPRYVAVVEKAENITTEYIKMIHKMNRKMGTGIFGTFIWGIVTGYDVESATRMIEDAQSPMIIRTALSTTPEMRYTSFFDKCVVIDPNIRNNMFSRHIVAFQDAMANADPELAQQVEQLNKIISEKRQEGQPVDDSLLLLQKEHQERLQVNRYLKEPRVTVSWGEKREKNDTLTKYEVAVDSLLYKFWDLYGQLDPEFLLTCSYGLEELKIINALNYIIRADQGKLYADTKQGKLYLPAGEHRRVYLAVGNNGGAMFGKSDNLVTAWIKDGNVSALAGYCVPEWHGQAGWGTWKFWMTDPGRYSLAEAVYLNTQFIISRLNEWNPKFLTIDYPETDNAGRDYRENLATVGLATGQELVTLNQMGYLYDRDVFVYYGDPKWDVRLNGEGKEVHYKVSGQRKGKKYILTIQTDEQFRRQQMTGNYYMEKPDPFNPATIGRLPFSYFFPERLKGAKLAKKLKFEGTVEVNDNFIFIHDCFFEPNETYKVVLSVE
ncbi:MAG TPA: hypothetical protein H9796_02060 [Candidatus Butyricimonas faecavium]|nr:hypothetical protein [Candidatus Butyricimonas faecavium]